MNNELIERIDGAYFGFCSEKTEALVMDCKAEIERLTIENANYVQALKCINELEAKPSIDALIAETYKPMTDDELGAIWEKDKSKYIVSALSAVERAVIERLGLVWGD